ncbi:MAG: hypothetical protein Q9170_002594 [Blastenia crenularia]
MANQRFPDGRLVYLHCSSIFSGENALLRRQGKISRLLREHQTSIKVLTSDFTLPAITVVVKQLLEEQIFERLSYAKVRYPELFQPSGTQEAERAGSEAQVLKTEAAAAQDVEKSDDEEDEPLVGGRGEKQAEHRETALDKSNTTESFHASGVASWQVSFERHLLKCDSGITNLGDSTPVISAAHRSVSVPSLHPIYLPLKTQHKVLVTVQYLLEECCFEFGNAWVPKLMEERKWYEVESIELNQCTLRFLKYAKSLPPSAINPTGGENIAQVLLRTSTIRHSAVHRNRISAAGVVIMLDAAIAFAETLKDSRRAEKIANIKLQLESSIEEIVQHQNLLERKLSEQLEAIAQRRAELDALERTSIEEMLAIDKKQRAEVGSTLECALAGSQPDYNISTCNGAPRSDGDSEARREIRSSTSGQDITVPTDHQSEATDTFEEDYQSEQSEGDSSYQQDDEAKESAGELLDMFTWIL